MGPTKHIHNPVPCTTLLPRLMLVLLLSNGMMGALQAAEPRTEARLLRFPTTHGNRLVFSHAGDLYTVSTKGGTARRLTSDPGFEMFPRFSPDGKTLAFTAQYDGNTEVYIMPADGGEPRRITYTASLERDDVSDRMGPNNIVLGWRGNDQVLYRSRRIDWNPFKGHLYLAPITGAPSQELPLPRGGWSSFSADGRKLAYNQVFREFRTWKRYRGGQADDIWLHDLDTKTTTRLTEDPAQDIFPMWAGDKIYFVSDRDDNRRLNLFVTDAKGKKPRQLTTFTEFDVKFPSLGDNAIVFENGGFIYRHDLRSDRTEKISIQIQEDLAGARTKLRDVSKETTRFDIAPDGSRAVIGARGDVFTVPAKNGPTRNLTSSPGVHERNAVWSPDGRWIAYISDATGEDEIWVRAQDGQEPARQITSGADTYKYAIVWSPDSKQIAWGDKKNRLQTVEVETRQVRLVAESKSWEIRDFSWAPDSQWIAYVLPEPRRFSNVHIQNLQTRETVQVSDGWFDVGQPTFSADGRFLFFISDRSFSPQYGSTEWNHIYTDMQRIYMVTLGRETKSPFAPKSDEVKLKPAAPDAPPEVSAQARDSAAKPATPADTTAKPAGNSPAAKEEKRKPLVVDAAGLQERIAVLPPPAGGYWNLSSVGEKLFYTRKGKLHVFDFEKEKETEVGDVADYVVSADGKKMLVREAGGFAIVDLPSGKLDSKDKSLNLSDLKVELDRKAEWNQIYAECWRQMRDFFYDPQLHQVDWNSLRARYQPLLDHVHHRADLTYIIGELIGELNAGHAYVGGGDYPKPERIPLGLLGARVSKEPDGSFRLTKILRGQNWDPKYRSPLTEIGVGLAEGDYILSVNGKSARDIPNLDAALIGTAGKQVRLRVSKSPSQDGSREVVVIPTADEHPLYYLNWVLGNIETVSKATGGRVGYVHIPDMGVPGLNEFTKFYYAQLHKEALIVDCRGNGGGNVSPMIIERLRREPAMWTIARNGSVNVDPTGQVLGPKVLLIDQFSASDGDIVAYRFRHHKLGPIIGQRSWGGVVGIRGTLPLLDGGYLNRPEFSRFDLDAKEWIMEGVGVEPDIKVENDPTREYGGTDDQLARAVESILDQLNKKPVQLPAPPPYPDKRK